MREKIWEFKSQSLKQNEIRDFAHKFNLPPAIAIILMNRGISTEEQVRLYLNKELSGVHNPFMLNDMDIAADRIVRAINEREPTVIYGDYDVDGITSTASLYKFLKSRGADVEYYIPDRKKEGYGINIMAINRLAKKGKKLMISVDCGITAVGEVEFAKTQGMEVIITDHHTCKEEIPRAVAVINPKRPDSEYPFSGLAGVGVAFKLILAIAVKLGLSTKDIFMEYVDMVAVGTIADVVPVLDENRVIVDKGMQHIKSAQNLGIKAMLEVSGLNKKPFCASGIAFSIAPRLNVSGRLENAGRAVELLITEDYEKALETAKYLDALNRKRQEIEQEIYTQAMEQAESFSEDERYVYVLEHEGWNNGVIGIVASKISERFYRPCILISSENGNGKGSGRSIEGFNLFDALTECNDVLNDFGGHSQAAGLSIKTDSIPAFRKKINEYAKKNLNKDILVSKLKIECRIDTANITLNAAKLISRLEPFGMCNETPVFAAFGLRVVSIARMGAENRHIRMLLSGENGVINAVGFNMSEYADTISVGQTVSVAFTMNVNLYQDSERLQLMLKDIKQDRNL